MRAPLFNAMESSAVLNVARSSSVRVYETGELIFQQGDPAEAVLVLVEGWLKIYRSREDGEQVVIRILAPGETYFEPAMFVGGSFCVTAEAVSSARVLRLDGAAMRKAILQQPSLAFDLLAASSSDIEWLMGEIEELRTKSAPQRIADFLLRQIKTTSGAATIALPYGKALIANQVGTKPECFSRSLVKLREHGVRVERDKVRIHDVSKLAKYAGSSSGADKAPPATHFASMTKRRIFDDALVRAWRTSLRSGAPISLLLINVAHSKRCGDGFVRAYDRHVLTSVGNLIFRDAQFAGRFMVHYDDEVFAVAAPSTDHSGARTLAEKLSGAIENSAVRHMPGDADSFLATAIGTATIFPTIRDRIEKIVCFADVALYRAKRLGRNRVCDFHDDRSCMIAMRSPSGGVRIPAIKSSRCAECRSGAPRA